MSKSLEETRDDSGLYIPDRVVGNGSFGVVYLGRHRDTNELVAIKKVLQDKRYKNRELQIMKVLNHPNIVALRHSFYSKGEKPDEVYLNLVLEFVPETIYKVVRHYAKLKQTMPMIHIKCYAYQMCRALAYLHAKGICHRDIKPQNLLVDPRTCVLKLCDFGSAKTLVRGEPNVAYICSRYYRAPELIFGATNYTTAVDVWSMGCVLAEMLLGEPLFPGESAGDQLVEIIKVLGTPTREQVFAMNPAQVDQRLSQVKPHPWSKVFRSHTPPEAVDLVSRLLQYVPDKRLKPMEALAHPFFAELRQPGTRLPGNKPLPPLFNFGPEEMAIHPDFYRSLIPPQPPADASAPGGAASGGAPAAAAAAAATPAAPAAAVGSAAAASSTLDAADGDYVPGVPIDT